MSALCIIPARSGSKGLPGKNLRHVGGVSLLGRCVHTAVGYTHQYPEHQATVLVISDDVSYLQEAHRYGAQHTIQQPAELASDQASSEVAMMYAWQSYAQPVDVLVLLQCTSPFTTPEDIAKCVNLVTGHGNLLYQSALTVVETHAFLWAEHGPRGWSEGATGINHVPLLPRQRRQVRMPEYLETGGVYAVRAEAFRQTPHRFAAPIGLVVIDAWRGLEIDTAEDLRLAELVHADRQAQEAAYATV